MKYLTNEQAKTLKDNGFPQPEFEIGQLWYSAFLGYLSVACARQYTAPGHPALAPLHFSEWSHDFAAVAMIGDATNMYVPTADEILRDLNGHVALSYSEDKGFFCFQTCYFPRLVIEYEDSPGTVFPEQAVREMFEEPPSILLTSKPEGFVPMFVFKDKTLYYETAVEAAYNKWVDLKAPK